MYVYTALCIYTCTELSVRCMHLHGGVACSSEDTAHGSGHDRFPLRRAGNVNSWVLMTSILIYRQPHPSQAYERIGSGSIDIHPDKYDSTESCPPQPILRHPRVSPGVAAEIRFPDMTIRRTALFWTTFGDLYAGYLRD